MLDDLTREQPANRLVGLPAQVSERVGSGRLESMFAAPLDSLHIGVDAAGRDPALAQHGQELAASAPDVHHVGCPIEIRQVRALVRHDLLARPTEGVLEADVRVRVEIGHDGLRRPGRHAVVRGRGCAAEPLELALHRVRCGGDEIDRLS